MKAIFQFALLLLTGFHCARAALPSPWLDRDIGTATPAGSADFVSRTGTFTMKGSGEIHGTADAFHYCYQMASGDFTFTARLTKEDATAGIMLRETTAADSPHIMLFAEPGYWRYVYRAFAGGQSIQRGISRGTVPAWFRITRYGELVHLSWSSDGKNWTQAQVIAFRGLAGSVCIGMGVAAGGSGTPQTAMFDSVSLEPVQIATPTSWLGNTWPGGEHCVGAGVTSICVDPATGMMCVNGESENYSTSIYNADGSFVGPCINSHFKGGCAIASDGGFIYSAQTLGGKAGAGVAIYDHHGMPALSSILLQDKEIRGLACDSRAGELYIADNTSSPGVIHVFNTTSRTEVRSFPADRARNMAVAPDGTLWIVQDGDGGANPPKVLHYGAKGNVLPGEIAGIAQPRGIAVSGKGLVYVTDTGPDQNIKIYNPDGSSHGAFGALGGIYSGTKGAIAPDKLNNPVGVGLDNNGNIWVACNGPKTPWEDIAGGTGAQLRKYDLATGKVQWERFGLEYVDCASADPAGDGTDVFTKNNHYVMDYSRPTGQQWTYAGMTIDQFAYPGDARIAGAKMGPAMVRRINGKRYLFVTDQQGGWLWFYRFQAGSEIAIPLGYMQRETDRGKHDNHFGIWHDTNGNGAIDSDEMDIDGQPAGPPSREIFCYSVDKEGSVWTMDGANIRCYSPLADANGSLYYSSSTMKEWPYPAAFTGANAHLLRAYYDPDKDEMYLGGYTADAPKLDTSYGLIGTRIIKYSGFKAAGAVKEVYRIVLARDSTSFIKAMDVAGGYLAFVNSAQSIVHLYNADTGKLITRLSPGPEVGLAGWVDCNNGIQMFPRSNGELLLFVEEDNEAKVLMYRYRSP